MKYMQDLGKKIATLRGGMSQRELARRAGIEQNTLWRIENGDMKLVSPHVKSLSSALGMTEHDLLVGDANKFRVTQTSGSRLPVWGYALAAEFVYSSPDGAGQRSYPDEQAFVLSSKNYSSSAFALEVTDRAMEPHCPLGIVAVIEPERTPTPNCVVAVGYQEDQRTLVALRYFHDQGPNGRGQRKFEAVPAVAAFRTLQSTDPGVRLLGVMAERHFYE